jgi:hypothetical protein
MIDYGVTFEQAIADARFSHVSTREFCGATRVLAYFRDAQSPSGVFLAAGAKLTDVEALLRARGIPIYSGPTRGDIAARQWGIGGGA